MSEYDLTFPCTGCEFRLLLGDPVEPGCAPAREAAALARRWLETCDARLSRFRATSDLVTLNSDPAWSVRSRPLLMTAVEAVL
jgi:hypothetical protein